MFRLAGQRDPVTGDSNPDRRASPASGGFGGSSPGAKTEGQREVARRPTNRTIRLVTPSAAEDRVDEGLGFERREVVWTLPEPDQLDRDAKLALHGDHNAPLRGAVQLG